MPAWFCFPRLQCMQCQLPVRLGVMHLCDREHHCVCCCSLLRSRLWSSHSLLMAAEAAEEADLAAEVGTAVEPPLKEWECWTKASIRRALTRRRQAIRRELGIPSCRCAHGCVCHQDSAGAGTTEPEPPASHPGPKPVARVKAMPRPARPRSPSPPGGVWAIDARQPGLRLTPQPPSTPPPPELLAQRRETAEQTEANIVANISQ